MVAEKRRFNYKSFKVEMEAEKPENAATITSIKAKMQLVTDAEEKAAQTVLRLTLDTCPVGVIFHKAGIELNWTLTLKKP